MPHLGRIHIVKACQMSKLLRSGLQVLQGRAVVGWCPSNTPPLTIAMLTPISSEFLLTNGAMCLHMNNTKLASDLVLVANPTTDLTTSSGCSSTFSIANSRLHGSGLPLLQYFELQVLATAQATVEPTCWTQDRVVVILWAFSAR